MMVNFGAGPSELKARQILPASGRGRKPAPRVSLVVSSGGWLLPEGGVGVEAG